MKKLLLALAAVAACAVSTGALAQPMHPGGPAMHRPHVAPGHRKHKVWVPARRVHGRLVRGHYVWR